MQKVERGQLGVMTVHAVVAGLMLLFAGTAGEIALWHATEIPNGLVLLPLIVAIAFLVFVAPRRRYEALGYALDGEELRVASGLWVRTETVVPLKRVQHIDVSQGPVERAFAVTRLVLHTAGTMNSLVLLPGLSRETAEAIRDEIRARIRREVE